MYVIKPDANDESEPFDVDQLRVDDYMAYFRMAKRSFEAKLASPPDATSKPEPCNHCQVCNWWPKCDKEWRDADHLTLIAGIAKSQRVELVEQGVTSLTQFAEAGYGKIGDELLGLVQSLDRSPDGDRELVNQWAVRLGLLPTFGRGR